MGGKGESLFGDFSPMTKKEWWEKVEKDLKGKDPSTLIRVFEDGFSTDPLYTREESPSIQQSPGRFPYRRGMDGERTSWGVREPLFDTGDPDQFLKDLREAVDKRGVNAIAIPGRIQMGEGSLRSVLEECVSKGISLDLEDGGEEEVFLLLKAFKGHSGAAREGRGGLGMDPIGDWLRTGKWKKDKETDLASLKRVFSDVKELSPFLGCIEIRGDLYQNSGATPVQEITCAVAQGIEYLDILTAEGYPVDTIAGRIRFSFSISNDLLVEMAKLRAVREAWARVVEHYKPTYGCTPATLIHGRTSDWEMTVADAYNNIIRATTQVFAGICGGADQLSVRPFDAAFRDPTGFSKRVAVNVHHILREEGRMGKVADPLGGAWYLEYLTDRLGERAWEELKKIEEKGGLIAEAEKGRIQEWIGKVREKKLEAIRQGKRPVIGVNLYPNDQEELTPEMVDQGDPGSESADIKPLRPIRGAQVVETEMVKQHEA